VLLHERQNLTPWTRFEGVAAHVVGSACAAVPLRFLRQAWAPALSAGIPVDVHISEGDVHRLAKAVIPTGIKR